MPLQGIFPQDNYPQLLVGLGSPDDSAVYKINDQQAIISTTDFFPPVVDDPYAFGAIAAANALSDVYAMGGTPLMAINLVAYPDGLIEIPMLTEILRGGAEKVREAGAVIAGGHTVTDKEPKYGLAVTGTVHPDEIIPKGGAQVGDVLILTKPMGTGVVTTALKRSMTTDDEVEAATESMLRLNRDAAMAGRKFGAHGMTDITGYGLIGHGMEMARLSGTDFHIQLDAIEWLPGTMKYAEQDVFPGGMWNTREYLQNDVSFPENLADHIKSLLFNPETSGGLLLAIPSEQADAAMKYLLDLGVVAQRLGDVRAGSGRMHVR